MIASDDTPPQILLDAGPLIGAVDVFDQHHAVAAGGFRRLEAFGTELLIPLPVLFEVYKRVAYDISTEVALQALAYMRQAADILYLGPLDLQRLHESAASMPWWGGSLEDVTLAMIGLARNVPVWTFNYRDLRAFQNLHFWTPG